MRIYIDLVTLIPTSEIYERSQIIQSAGAKRGDGDPLEVLFHRSGVPERLPIGTAITFCGKTAGKQDEDPPLVICQTFLRPLTDEEFYFAEPDYNGEALSQALNSGDGDDGNDISPLLVDGEISWLLPGYDRPRSTKTFTVTIENDVYKGDEALPSPAGPTYLTQAQSDARYLQGQIVSTNVTSGLDYVDFVIASGAKIMPVAIEKPSPASDNIVAVSFSRPTSTTARLHLSAPAPSAGYIATILKQDA
jgi:hypothetical protein